LKSKDSAGFQSQQLKSGTIMATDAIRAFGFLATWLPGKIAPQMMKLSTVTL